MWGEEGSVESRHILGQPQSLSQFLPRLFYSFHPHSEKSLSFFPLYIQPICPIKYISSSLIRKKKSCQPEFNRAPPLKGAKKGNNPRWLFRRSFVAPVAMLTAPSNPSVASIRLGDGTRAEVQSAARYTSSFPNRQREKIHMLVRDVTNVRNQKTFLNGRCVQVSHV